MAGNEVFQAALHLLKVRERTEQELEQRLRRKGFELPTIRGAIDRCRELGYVSDERFARNRARQLLTGGRAVGFRLRRELLAAGIDESLADAVIQELETEFDGEALLEQVLRQRFPAFDYRRAEDREKRRVVHYFLRRGFPLQAVLNRLKHPD